MAGSVIGALRVNLGLDSANFVKGLSASQKRMRDFGKRMALAGAAISAAGVGIAAGVRAQLNAADDMSKAAQKIGIPTDELSRLAHAADMSGVSMTTLQTGVQRLSKVMVEQPKKLAAVGIAARDASGKMRPVSEVMAELAEKLAEMPDGAEKTALAMELMGRGGADMIPMLNGGKKALKDMLAEADALGIVFTPEMGKSAEAFNDNLSRLRKQASGIFTVISTNLAPVLVQISDYVVQLAAGFRSLSPDMQRWISIAAGAVVVLGPVISGLGLMIMSMGPFVAAMTAGAAAIKGIGLALAANPIGLAAAAVGAAAYLIYKEWDGVKAWFSRLWSDVRGYFSGFAEFIAGVFTGDLQRAVDGLKLIWTSLRSFFDTLWAGISGAVTAAWEHIIRPVLDAFGLTEPLIAAWRAVEKALQAVLESLGAVFEAAWSRIEPIIGKIKGAYEAVTGYNQRLNGTRDGQISTRDPGATYSDGPIVPPPVDVPGDLAEGLRQGSADIQKQGFEDAQGYVKSAREGWGIKSPSRVMRELGQYLAQGLSIGIGESGGQAVNQFRAITDQMGDMAQTIRGSFERAFEGVVTGTVKVGDAVSQMASELARFFAQRAASWLGNAVFGGFGGGGDALTAALGAAGAPVRAFANGGWHGGGMRLVGEHGAELEATGPARYWTAQQTRQMLAGGGEPQSLAISLSLSADLDARIADTAKNVTVAVVREYDRNHARARAQKSVRSPREVG